MLNNSCYVNIGRMWENFLGGWAMQFYVSCRTEAVHTCIAVDEIIQTELLLALDHVLFVLLYIIAARYTSTVLLLNECEHIVIDKHGNLCKALHISFLMII